MIFLSSIGSLTTNGSVLFFSDGGDGATHVASLNGTYLYDIPPSTLDAGEYGGQFLDGVGFQATGLVYLPGDGGLLLVADEQWEWMSVYSLKQQQWEGRCAIMFPVGQFYSYTMYAAAETNHFWIQVQNAYDNSPNLLKYGNVTLAGLAENGCPYINSTQLPGSNGNQVAVGGGYIYYVTDSSVFQYDTTDDINLLATFALPLLNNSADQWGSALVADAAGDFYTASLTTLAGFRSTGTQFLSLTFQQGPPAIVNTVSTMQVLPDGSFILAQSYRQQLLHVSRTGVQLSVTTSPYLGGGIYSGVVVQPGSDVIWQLSTTALQAAHKSSETLIPNTTLWFPFGNEISYGAWMGFDHSSKYLFVGFYSNVHHNGRICRLLVANVSAPYLEFAVPVSATVRGLASRQCHVTGIRVG